MSTTGRLKKLLEEEHSGPFVYLFKFVMPLSAMEGFTKLIPNVEMVSRLSANSQYVSLSFEIEVESASVVVEIYDRVKSIPGLIAL
jgi:uncharacterized protein